MTDLIGYTPDHPDYKLPNDVSFPKVIFEGAKSMDEVRKQLSGQFVTESMTSAKAVRFLDDYELATIRKNYSELLEDEQPKLEAKVVEVEAACKAIVKEAKDKLQAAITQIKDLAFQAKKGEKEVDLPGDSTVRMALFDHYLYYAWINGEFRLCKVERVPSWDEDSLFANSETNREAFAEVLGIDVSEAYGADAAPEGEAE